MSSDDSMKTEELEAARLYVSGKGEPVTFTGLARLLERVLAHVGTISDWRTWRGGTAQEETAARLKYSPAHYRSFWAGMHVHEPAYDHVADITRGYEAQEGIIQKLRGALEKAEEENNYLRTKAMQVEEENRALRELKEDYALKNSRLNVELEERRKTAGKWDALLVRLKDTHAICQRYIRAKEEALVGESPFMTTVRWLINPGDEQPHTADQGGLKPGDTTVILAHIPDHLG